MKTIIKIVHLPSVVQSEFYEVTRILFVRQENKNNDIYSAIHLLSVSHHQRSAILESIRWTQSVDAIDLNGNSVSNRYGWPRTAYTLCVHRVLRWHGEETNCWINDVICIFFAYKKYSRHFIKFRLNLWFLHGLWFSVTSHHVYL